MQRHQMCVKYEIGGVKLTSNQRSLLYVVTVHVKIPSVGMLNVPDEDDDADRGEASKMLRNPQNFDIHTRIFLPSRQEGRCNPIDKTSLANISLVVATNN